MNTNKLAELIAAYPRLSFDLTDLDNGIMAVADLATNMTVTYAVTKEYIGYSVIVQTVQGNNGRTRGYITEEKFTYLFRWQVVKDHPMLDYIVK